MFSPSWFNFTTATKGGKWNFPVFFQDFCIVYNVFVLCSTSRVRESLVAYSSVPHRVAEVLMYITKSSILVIYAFKGW